MSEQPEGVPVGMRIKRLGKGRHGEWVIFPGDKVCWQASAGPDGLTENSYVVLEPNNLYGMPLELVTMPEGHEYDGVTPEEWYRFPKPGQTVVSPRTLDPIVCTWPYEDKHICIRPIKRKKHYLLVRPVDVTYMEPHKVTLQYGMAGGDHIMELDFGIDEREE